MDSSQCRCLFQIVYGVIRKLLFVFVLPQTIESHFLTQTLILLQDADAEINSAPNNNISPVYISNSFAAIVVMLLIYNNYEII